MNSLRRSWLLFVSSLRVMMRNPKLLLFPVVIAGVRWEQQGWQERARAANRG